MTETDKFLAAYQRFENALNKSTKLCVCTVLEYENLLKDRETADKLKTCRIIRNYLCHHEDGKKTFPASPQMTKFLIKLSESVERMEQTCGQACKRTILVTPKMTVREAVQNMKTPVLPYKDDSGYFLLTEHSLLLSFQKDLLPSALLKQKAETLLKEPAVVADVHDALKDFKAGTVVVNQKTGTYKGILL